MISSFWTNIAPPEDATQILIASNQTQVNHQVIDLNTVFNRGELVGLLIETLTKVIAPGAADLGISVFYAFSMRSDRTPAQLATGAAEYEMTLDAGGVGTLRSYSLPIVYQGGQFLHIWFTSDTFTNGTSQQEVVINVLAKTMN